MVSHHKTRKTYTRKNPASHKTDNIAILKNKYDRINQMIKQKKEVFNPVIINKCDDINKGKVKLCKMTKQTDCNKNPLLCRIYINDTEFNYDKSIIDKCNIDSHCWFEYYDEEAQSKYWFNLITKEATWINPTKQVKQKNKMAYSISSFKPLLYKLGTRNRKTRLSPIKEKIEIRSLSRDNKKSRTPKRTATV